MKKIRVALLGYGTVGQGSYALLHTNRDLLSNRLQLELEVPYIYVRNLEKYAAYPLQPETQFTDSIDTIMQDLSIDIIVEVMGGTTFAKECVETAIKNGKHVVTANKDLLAEAGPYLQELAAKHKVDLRFEAAVMGGIPIIRTLYDSLAGNKITEMVGILNGTTNFILSKMTEEGSSYAEVLKEAQALGFAEADPTSDVEGYDSARKLAILSSIGFNKRIFFEDVGVEGITTIDKADIEYGKEFKYTIKLIGVAKETKKGLSLHVYPAFIPNTHPLASVRGSYNALYIKGNGFDDAMFYGRGAGDLPTGSSIVSDIMEIAKNVSMDKTGQLVPFYYPDKNLYAPGKITSQYYIRLTVVNTPGVLAKVAQKLADQRISVLSVLQRNENPEWATLAITTSECPHAHIENLVDAFKKLRIIQEVNNVIRIMN